MYPFTVSAYLWGIKVILKQFFREVHTSDLRRADEGNPDFKPDDPDKVNWAKFNMFGRFVATPVALQRRCLATDGYKLTENKAISQLLEIPVMDYEVGSENSSFDDV